MTVGSGRMNALRALTAAGYVTPSPWPPQMGWGDQRALGILSPAAAACHGITAVTVTSWLTDGI